MELISVLLCGGFVMGLLIIVCRAFGRSTAPRLMADSFHLQVGLPAGNRQPPNRR